MLTKWFEAHPVKLASKDYPKKLIETLKELNSKIIKTFGVEYQVGHSYFMVLDMTEQYLHRILKYSVQPLLEQYFYGKKEDVNELIEICNAMLPSSSINSSLS